ncbi:hypothetical protein GF324_12705, partial [bacterium]|nr:hypothetical protein [bacterium]
MSAGSIREATDDRSGAITFLRLSRVPGRPQRPEKKDSFLYQLRAGNSAEFARDSVASARSVAMIRHALTLFFRSVRRSPGISAINLIGLVLGFTVVLLISLFVAHELSYDRHFPNADQVVRLITRFRVGTQQDLTAPVASSSMAMDLANGIDEIETVLRIDTWGGERHVQAGDKTFVERKLLYVDSTFFDVFPFPLKQGDPKTALNRTDTVVLTEEAAQRYFGREDPVGQELILDNYPDRKYIVTGVLETITEPTHLREFSVLISWVTKKVPDDDPWINNVNWATYFVL